MKMGRARIHFIGIAPILVSWILDPGHARTATRNHLTINKQTIDCFDSICILKISILVIADEFGSSLSRIPKGRLPPDSGAHRRAFRGNSRDLYADTH